TALAEAEVEYHDHVSDTIWVKFPIVKAPVKELVGANVVIWTTTPWTIPGNRAVAFGPAMDYVAVEVKSIADRDKAKIGDKLLLTTSLKDFFFKETAATETKEFWQGK